MKELVKIGAIGPIRCRGREILRRIFVTVRDPQWREIGPNRWEAAVDESRRIVRLSGRHTSDLVDFEWVGELEVSEDGRGIGFEFTGTVLRDMEACRVGLVVLHSVESMVGAHVRATGPQGSQELAVGGQIAPQPMRAGQPIAMTEPFSQLLIEHPSEGSIELNLSGDLFELEDQRNWGDASFKTYCTPLRLGFPRQFAKGTVIRHALHVTYRPHQGVPLRPVAPWPRTITPVTLEIGRMIRGNEPSELLQGWDHLRLDLDEGTAQLCDRLVRDAPGYCRLEVTVGVRRGERLPSAIVNQLSTHASRIARVLVRDVSQPLPDADSVAALRWVLQTGPRENIPLFALPNGYFVELNRGLTFDLPVDGVAFPLSPTVHSDDPETVMDNVGAVEAMALTLRKLIGDRPVCISPLALHYPAAASSSAARAVKLTWLAGVIARASRTGMMAVTLAPDLLTD